MRSPRAVDTARFVLGVVLTVRPDLPLRLSEVDGEGVQPVVRALGIRYLGQAAAGIVASRRGHPTWVAPADAAVDLVHAATMVVAAVAFPAHRRLAITSAVAAVAFAAADLADRPASSGQIAHS